jgi:phosphoribosylanthranilate isomerase
MMVKICGITNREDALAAIDGGAAALGFNFYAGSPRYIAPEAAAVIAAGLPARVWKVGVFVDEAAANVERIARQVGLDVAQLHGSETPKQYPRGTRVWKAGHFGPYGGRYVPEVLMAPLEELEQAYLEARPIRRFRPN